MCRALTTEELIAIKTTIRECGNFLAKRVGKVFTDEGVEAVLAEGLKNTQRLRNSDMERLGKKFYFDYKNQHGVEMFFEFEGEQFREVQPEEQPKAEEPAEQVVEVKEGPKGAVESVNPFVDYVKAQVMEEVEKKMAEVKPRSIEVKFPERIAKIDGLVHKEFETVLAYVNANEPVFLYGRAGTGKNVLCKQVAEALGLEFYFSNAVTQEHKLTGFIDAMGVYHETQFYQAFTKGGVFMLDEMDASIPEVLIILNSAIANRYFDFPTGRVEAHPDFRVIGAGNTCGTGATYAYNGRNQLDGASLDRFAMVAIDYDEDVELGCAGGDKELVEFVHEVRESAEKAGVQIILSYRGINRLAKMIPVLGVAKAFLTGLVKGMDKTDLNAIIAGLTCQNEYAQALRNLA